MNKTIDDVSATRRFLEAHEQLETDFEALQKVNQDQANKIVQLEARCASLLDQANAEHSQTKKWLRYSVTLVSQIQFLVAGSARALAISDEITRELEVGETLSPEDKHDLGDLLARLAAKDDRPSDHQPSKATASLQTPPQIA